MTRNAPAYPGHMHNKGMTKREEVASRNLAALLASGKGFDVNFGALEVLADQAIAAADALFDALEK